MTLGPQFFRTNGYSEPPSSRALRSLAGNYTIHEHDGGRESVVYQYRPTPNEAGASLNVVHHGGSSVTKIPHNYDAAWASRTEPGETIPLFEREETAPHSTIETLAGTEAARVPAMTLLGIADVETQRDYGRSPISSASLSDHSRRLLQHLEDVRAATLPDHEVNNLTYWDENRAVASGSPLPRDVVRAGRNRLRSVLRSGRRQPPQTTRYEQPELPGTGS